MHQMVKPDNKHGGKPQAKNAFRLLERLGTNPKVYYLSSREWVHRAGDNYLADEFETIKKRTESGHAVPVKVYKVPQG